MDNIITANDMVEGLDFLDPRKFRRYFTADNEPIYVPINESTSGRTPIAPSGKQRKVKKERKKSPDSCIYYRAEDVAEMLGISKSQAYKVIHSLNDELKTKDVIIQAGRVPKPFFHEKYYGLDRMISEQKK